MSAGLEWPATARLTAEARREISAEHDRQQRAAIATRAAQAPEPLLARRVAQLERKLTTLERALADRPRTAIIADAIGKNLADLHGRIDRAISPEVVREAVGEAMAQLHAGIWRADKAFPQGCMTTSDGSLWLAMTASKGVRPGSGAAAWRLIAKGYRPTTRSKKETAT